MREDEMRVQVLTSVLLAETVVLFIGSVALGGCQPNQTGVLTLTTAASNMTELPTILNRTDIEEHFPDPFDAIDDDEMDERLQARDKGKQVRLIGQYIQVDVRRWPKPPPRYKGHVAVVLEDGTEVFLYPPWHSEAIRSTNEITRYNNRGVAVVGKIVPECPKSPQPAASIVAPCMLTIDFIDLVD
ncbi:histidine kinase [Coleofasciculus sp. E1-EBD-02]|uniref:histidine kinase n=1 Tax=Coleofasciculus sp. E1-EBD-02 TaxID=3068481 RepID=UPI0032F3940D